MRADKKIVALAKTLHWILGMEPDRFGLIPGADGWIPVKELLKALSEEEDLRWVRAGHFNEIIQTLPAPPIELANSRVRATDRSRLFRAEFGPELPAELHLPIRAKAWPHVHEKGLFPPEDQPLVLARTREMATRLGKRKDPSPVLVTVRTPDIEVMGVTAVAYGSTLVTLDFLPRGCFYGPALPKEREPKKKTAPPKSPRSLSPGSYVPSAEALLPPGEKKERKRDRNSWKENRKRLRKEKDRW